MKKVLLFIVSSLIIILSCKKSSSPSPTPPKSDINLKTGLLVYLPFDGNMADSSGNGNLTSAVGGAALTFDEHGNANSAFGGTGDGERLLITNNGSIKFDTAFSLSFDIMLRNAGRFAFVNMVDNTTATAFSFGVGTTAISPYNVDFDVSDSLATCASALSISNLAGDSSAFVPASESWYNLLTIFHKGTLQIYVNGRLISTKTEASSTVPICPNAKMIVGGWWDGDPTSINGKLDEVRLYNRVLNTDEIAELSKNFQ
jgi:Concanavalin A-like lectin/glucanases superfamily